MTSDSSQLSFDTTVFNGIESSVLRKIGIEIDNPQQLFQNEKFRKVLLTALDWVTFAETYFRDPNDLEKPLILEKWQKDIMRYTQTGKKKYMILVCPRGFGKSLVVSCIAAIIAIHCPQIRIGLYGMGRKQSSALLEKIRYFIKNSQFENFLPKKGSGLDNNKERIQLLNAADIRSFPCTEGVRGPHNDYVFVDEASRIPDKIINEAIRPTGRRARKEIDFSTPAGMTGEFWRSFQNIETYHVTQIGALDVSWMTPELLAAEEQRLGPFAARQELHGEFIPTGDTLISMEWIKGSYEIHSCKRIEFDKRFIPEAGRYMVMGADFGRDSDRSVFSIGHKNQWGVYQLDYMESILKAPYPIIVDRLAYLCKKYNCKLLIPDATGLGEPVMDMIAKKLREIEHSMRILSTSKKKKREGFIFTQETKMDLLNELMRIYAEGLISVPFHQNDKLHETYQLELELLNFEFEIKNTGGAAPTIRFGTQSGNDDRLTALALMLYGLFKRSFTTIGMRSNV